tara:strand:- start:3976 stop:5553 length:1578 start_codon:yes stop_codon:yes gene_type:complete
MAYELTKEQIIKEIVKCGKKPVYFINTYAKIPHPGKGLIPFKTYDFQSELVDDLDLHRFIVVLKARQLGISTITAAYIAWLCLFHRDKNVLIIATKLATAANMVKKVKTILKHLPDWLRISDFSVDNKNSIELTNGSQVKASSTSGDAGRSEALSLLVIDEAAHIENLQDLWTGLYPTISTGGRCIAISTPNGVGDWFHETYVSAESGQNEFFPVKLLWGKHPDRDKEWFETETRNMSQRQIAQEYECNFNTSGDTVIHPDDIVRIKSNIVEPKYKVGFDRNIWIWEEPSDENNYLLVADVARGDGLDSSTFHVFKLETMELVCEYKGKPTPDLFAEILFTSGNEYNCAMLVVENNSVGYHVLDKLIEKEYKNIFYSKKSTHEYVDQYAAQGDSSVIPGFTTSSKTRPLIIAKFEEFIRNKVLTIYSTRLASELDTFIWRNGRPEAQRGYNDDLVMAASIGCWVRDTAIIENKKDIEYKKAFMNSVMTSNTHLDTNIPGMHKSSTLEKAFDEHIKNKQHLWIIKG